jgi:hypothetical protein
MNHKKRLVISYKNCSEEVLKAIREKYPNGYGDEIIKVQKPSGDFFYAITIDFEDVSYLVKVDVKIDNLTEEEFEKQFGSTGDDTGSSEVEKEDENPENLAATSDAFDE